MNIWLTILILILYAVFEFMASFSFNYKIKMINKKRFTSAAALGAFSTIIFTFLTSFAALYAAIGGGNMWIFIIAAAFMMALGNVTSLLVLKPFENYIEKRKIKKNPVEEGQL